MKVSITDAKFTPTLLLMTYQSSQITLEEMQEFDWCRSLYDGFILLSRPNGKTIGAKFEDRIKALSCGGINERDATRVAQVNLYFVS